MLEHAPLEAAKLRRRLEAELVERVARLPVRRERIRLPPRAVEGDDPLCLEALAVRVRDDERLELSGERRVAPRPEVEVDPRLDRGEPALVEPRGGGHRERLVREVGERRAAPERERLAETVRPRRGEPLEPIDVELVRLDPNQVPRRPGHDPVGSERPAQRMDMHLERVLGARGRRLAPDRVDQPVGGDDLVRVEQQLREQRPGPRPPERNRHPVVADHLQRPQQAELQRLKTPSLHSLKPSLGGS